MSEKTYAVDFETYYEEGYSLKTTTKHPGLPVHKFCTDSRFDAYMVSIYGEDVEFVGPPTDAPWQKINRAVWVSHNANFDQQVFLALVARKILSKALGPSQWFCTADLSVYLGGPRALDKAMKAWFDIDVSKEVRGKAKGKNCYTDSNAALPGMDFDVKEMEEYALDDSKHCLKLWDELSGEWPDHERWLAQLTHKWGWAGVYIDETALERAFNILQNKRTDALNLLPWAKEGKKPLSRKPLEAMCRKEKIPCPESLAADNPECAAWEKKFSTKYPWVDAIRTFRRANKHFRTVTNIMNGVNKVGYFPYSMKYFGAHTGRWGGDAGVNMQNPAKKPIFGADLRGYFIPAPDRKFIIADLCQIEPRILAWFTGNQPFLDAVSAGMSPYEAYARQSLDYQDDKPLKEKDPDLYADAKRQLLGLGYGLTAGFTKEEVNHFRQTNPGVVELWKKLEREFRNSLDDGYYEIMLPSGRKLHYWDIKHSSSRGLVAATTKGEGKYENFWGSKLVENAVSACARDVFGNCLLNLEEWFMENKVGRVVWHVHDEVIAEVDKEVEPDTISEVMCVPPEWMKDVPIAAEAIESYRYLK